MWKAGYLHLEGSSGIVSKEVLAHELFAFVVMGVYGFSVMMQMNVCRLYGFILMSVD